MKNADGRVIYVGKAKNLRRRLCQYFQTTRQHGKIKSLVAHIASIDVILVSTELESLILENNLIKRYRPRYNVLLVPDESGYGYVVKTEEIFPRLLPYKKNHYNKAFDVSHPPEIEKRFGPYLSNTIRDLLIKVVSESCGLRACDTMPRKVCFLYHLKRCSAPCEWQVTEQEYALLVERAEAFLTAPHLNLIDHLTQQMQTAADALEFERAKHIRDQIEVLKTVFERQVVERDLKHDQDVVYFLTGHALILHLMRGALIGLDWLPALPVSTPDAFLLDHYRAALPNEIIINALPDPLSVETALTQRAGHRIKITIPQRGASRDLLEIAQRNYDYHLSLVGWVEGSKNQLA